MAGLKTAREETTLKNYIDGENLKDFIGENG
jgi:hypothetical protein